MTIVPALLCCIVWYGVHFENGYYFPTLQSEASTFIESKFGALQHLTLSLRGRYEERGPYETETVPIGHI